jgi:putative oxidoreductase
MIVRIIQWLFPCFLPLNRNKYCIHIPCILHWLSRFILAGIFLYSGYIKWKSPLLFEAVLYTYDLFPNTYVPVMARYFPFVEMGLGLALLIGFRRKIRYLAGASILLLLFFIAILTITYLRGIEADCGCFSFDDPISPNTIARDSLMLIPALYLLCAEALFNRGEKRSYQA